MKSSTLPKLLCAGFLLAANTQTFAQNNRAFAITGETKGNVAWTVVREIDLGTGAEVRTIYAPSSKPTILDAVSGSRLQQSDKSVAAYNDKNSVTAPTETFVAASAYDLKTNRLFFTPMHSNELRYFDLNRGTNTVFYVRNTALKAFAETQGEADVITRMCFGSDGYGYALTNDGNHLIRFSSGEKITIVDLGQVQDGKNNNGISLRNMCTSWGGDMIADAFGNLYIISMKGNVFKMNPQTLVADFVGQIKNIPQDYTINAAAVDALGNVVVGCASKTENYYSVNLSTLDASVLPKQQQQVYNTSDLASCHFAYENLVNTPSVATKANVTVYPNPVINKTLNVSFDALKAGNHNVQITDAAGNSILSKTININGKTSTQIVLPKSSAGGMYLIKVTDSFGKEQYSGKVVVL